MPEVCSCCGKHLSGTERILDHPLGEKGRLEADGTRHSATMSMPEAKSAHPDLLAEVEEQDSTGKVENPRFSLASILAAIRTDASNRGFRGTELDREVVRAMGAIIRGLNLLHATRKEAHDVIAEARIEEVGGARFAILPQGEVSPQVGIVLNEEYDVSGAIFRSGYNLGVARYPGRDTPDLRKLAQHLPGWFVHTAGFLACWGSRKSPATEAPPVETPQIQEELLALLKEVFN